MRHLIGQLLKYGAIALGELAAGVFIAALLSLIGILFVATLLSSRTAKAAELDQAGEDNLAVRFVPIKAKELVVVELIRQGDENARYMRLEKAVTGNGWRTERNSDSLDIPGKCTVEMLIDGYLVDCLLVHFEGRDVLQQTVKSSEDVIATIKAFSRLWLYRLPPQRKERPVRTILV